VVKHPLAALAGATLALGPAAAWACPSCAGNPGNSVARMVLIGLMIAAPYAASIIVVRIIRKGEAAMSREAAPEARSR
jgi:hypothetical protein